MNEIAIKLWRRTDDSIVDGTLYTELTPIDLSLLEQSWQPSRSSLYEMLDSANIPQVDWPQSLHWNWNAKAPALEQLEAACFGIRCGGQWQAAMMTKTATHFSRASQSRGMPLVYIEYVESAPWNWSIPAVAQVGRYGGLGATLFRQAVLQSYNEGFAGRVGLHALPQAEPFYAKLGLIHIGRDHELGLEYFELDSNAADALIEGE